MQINLDFSGKKDQRITFAASEELKNFLEMLVRKLGRDNVSELVNEYVIECATRDMGKIMLLESRKLKAPVNISQL